MSGMTPNGRLFPDPVGGRHARGSAVPVECENAFRQDLHRLPARRKARRQARACCDFQARLIIGGDKVRRVEAEPVTPSLELRD
jgi:hypothetical protein